MYLDFTYKDKTYGVVLFEVDTNWNYQHYEGYIIYHDQEGEKQSLDFAGKFNYREPKWIFRYNSGTKQKSFKSLDEGVRFMLAKRLSYEIKEETEEIFNNSQIKRTR